MLQKEIEKIQNNKNSAGILYEINCVVHFLTQILCCEKTTTYTVLFFQLVIQTCLRNWIS